MPPRVELVERNLEVARRLENIEEHSKSKETTSTINQNEQQQQEEKKDYKLELVWRNIVLMLLLHTGALLGIRQCFVSAQWKTIVCAYFLYVIGGLGITAGAHRLWAHRSYRAKWPLRLLLACMQSMAFENSIYEWSRDHRVHHKYSETDADPHNALRGFFFSHVGWLLCRKHPDVKAKGKQIDLGDLHADPVVRIQHRYYLTSVLFFCFLMPTLIPYLGWGETLYNSFYICALLRYVVTLHATWLVNSAAHMWGRRPYDKNINPSENRGVSWWALGEGFHNYHHTFPWDYATSELGYDLNLSKMFIDFFAWFGWAYERKVVSPETIKQRKLRTGDTGVFGPYGPHNY